MLPYLIFIILVLLCWITHKPKLLVLILIVFSALRYQVGWDYDTYMKMFSTPEYLLEAMTRYGVFWSGLFLLGNYFNEPQLFFAAVSILTVSFFYFALRLLFIQKKDITDALLVYATWPFFFLGSLSTLRQGLAISVALFCFALLKNKKFFWAFIFFILNYFIHPSSVITIVYVLFIYKPKIRIYQTFFIIVCIVLGIAFLPSILPALGLDMYMEYLTFSDSFGTKIIFLFALIVFYFFYITYCTKSKLYNNTYSSIVIVSYLCSCVLYISELSSYIVRALDYFSVFLCLILFPSIQVFKNNDKLKIRLIMASVLVFFFLFYIFYTSGATPAGHSGYLPYKSILSKNI